VSVFVQIDEKGKGIRLKLHVQPGASKSEFAGTHDDALKLRIHARAEDGAANKAVCEFLALKCGLPKTSVSILSGHSSRKKIVLLEGDSDCIMEILKKFIS
jgi:uncharacterized protein (TIGR00251 family)